MISALLIIATIASLAFAIVAAVKAKECPDSVSSLSYIVGSQPFSAWACFTAICLLYPTAYALGIKLSWLAMLQSMGLILVAASPLYRTENKVIHYIGGYLFGVVSQVVVTLLAPYMLIAWIGFPLVFLQKGWRENATFVSEAICFGTLIITLIKCL